MIICCSKGAFHLVTIIGSPPLCPIAHVKTGRPTWTSRHRLNIKMSSYQYKDSQDGLYIETVPWFCLVVVTWQVQLRDSYGRQGAVSVIAKTAYHKILHKVSNPRNLYLEMSDCSDMWMASRYYNYRDACQFSKRSVKFSSDYFIAQSGSFGIVQDLMTKRLMRYWSGPCRVIYKHKLAKPALGSRHG